MAKEKKGVRLEHVSKIYQDPLGLRQDHHPAHDRGL